MSKYATKDMVFVLGMAIFFVSIIFAALIGYASVQRDNKINSFIASQYNFSESECILPIVSTINGEFSLLHQYDLINEHRFDEAQSINDEMIYCNNNRAICNVTQVGINDWLYSYSQQTGCSLYCHTQQIPTGEQECTNQTKEDYQQVSIGWRAINLDNYVKECYFDYNENCSASYVSESLWQQFHIALTHIESLKGMTKVNTTESVCTPLYKNITTFCATPDEIEKARSLIG